MSYKLDKLVDEVLKGVLFDDWRPSREELAEEFGIDDDEELDKVIYELLGVLDSVEDNARAAQHYLSE